jgi:superoxide reductase
MKIGLVKNKKKVVVIMKEKIFYMCSVCGNIVELVEGDMMHVTCCGKNMDLMDANIKDAAVEKHVPFLERINDSIMVRVGEVIHPMSDEHYIMWVAQVSNNKVNKVYLKPGDEPVVEFPYIVGSIVYAYCNLHGLWVNK